jgi:hypothetical protein
MEERERKAEPPGSSARAAPPGSRSPKACFSFLAWRPMVPADGGRWRPYSRIECAQVAENVQKRVECCEAAYDKVFYALAGSDGRISFRLASPRVGVWQELAHAKAILARLTCDEVSFYVGITQMPSRRWHGFYLDASSGTPVHHSRKGEPGIREEYLGHKEKWELMEIMHVTDSAEANASFEINLMQHLHRNPFEVRHN